MQRRRQSYTIGGASAMRSRSRCSNSSRATISPSSEEELVAGASSTLTINDSSRSLTENNNQNCKQQQQMRIIPSTTTTIKPAYTNPMSHSIICFIIAACTTSTCCNAAAAFSSSASQSAPNAAFVNQRQITKNHHNTITNTQTSFHNSHHLNRQLQLHKPFHSSSTTYDNTNKLTSLFASSSSTEDKLEGGTDSPSSSRSDTREWNVLISAFQMYKAAYGDLKVPSRFVVPSMPPWPEPAWGLKLGQRVAAIRSTGKFVEGNNVRRKILDDMGFLWRLRAPSPDKNMDVSFDQIYDALQTYRSEIQPEGSLTVPPNFIVPNYDPWPEATRGMPLGKKIPTVRSKAYLKANPDATQKLTSIGFQFDGKVAANDARFNNVYNALVRYKELNGDLLVPQPFIIPEQTDEWPEEVWGLRLGARVNAIRSQGTFVKTNPQRKEQLNKLGFEWELPTEGKKRGRKKKSEIEALSGPAPPGLLESDGSAASEDSVVNGGQADGTDPASVFGGSSSTYDDNFFQIGNERQGSPTWAFEDEEAEQQATQQEVVEEVLPPKNLNTTLQAAAEMAMSVGVIESLGQGKRVSKGKIKKQIPWFNDDFGEDFVFGDVVEALTIYKEAHGTFDYLEDDFIVPQPSLGGDIDVEASMIAAAAIAEAETKGEDSDALIAAEIARVEKEMANMDEDDVFGDDEDKEEDEDSESSPIKVQWPEHLANMRLGSIFTRIQDGSLEVKHLPERKAELDAIDFDWGDEKKFLDVPFEKSMCAIFGYYLIRGDLFVYEDFVMPGEEPWPNVLAGFELGKAVKRIRELQNFFEAYHPEKVQLLRRVEFVWFPELALPLNPEDGDDTWEDMLVEGVGHPFYQMNEPSVETLERLQGDGPWGPEDKLKSWYDYNEVGEFWEKGDITDTGKDSERLNWRPAEWLWFNGFEQLSREHEERYGVNQGLEVIRLIEEYHDGNISEKEFDERAGAAIRNWEAEQLRSEAISAGIDVDSDDDIDDIIQKVKEDPEFMALEEDPEYQKLIEAEVEADEAREAELLRMEAEAIVEEEEFEEEDDDDYEYVDEDEDDVEYVDEEDVEDDEDEEEEEDDFDIDEEEL